MVGVDAVELPSARALNARLHSERHRPGRGIIRGHDRLLTPMSHADLPDGAVCVDANGRARLVVRDTWMSFTFDGWTDAQQRPATGLTRVLTPPTSIRALSHGYIPVLHPSAHQL